MSHRDIRNFIEMMRALGYPSLISMESFRTPNFPQMSALLLWLVQRFDSEADLSSDISTEEARIKLVRDAAQFMALKANIKLNTKRLYQSDGWAVKELLKITTLLYEALNLNPEDGEEWSDENHVKNYDLSDKINELKLARQLASEMTMSGATLYELLSNETELKVARMKSLARTYELVDVEIGVKNACESLRKEISDTNQLIENVASVESGLDAKIERRKVEIDRYEKRLQTLKRVRPAFLEEFQLYEMELEELFVKYSQRLRMLTHLEHLMEAEEHAQLEQQMAKVSPRIPVLPLDVAAEEDALISRPVTKQERPGASTGRARTVSKTPKAFGKMQPPTISATPSLSSDTESDELFIDKDESELMLHSEDESLGLELSGMDMMSKRVQSSKPTVVVNSDDDF